MSVWVEIFIATFHRFCYLVTLHVSVWVEMLPFNGNIVSGIVTLHVSVWVEIQNDVKIGKNVQSHAPRERVSWIWNRRSNLQKYKKSRSTWACELKFWDTQLAKSRSTVTLHVSVWVEIFKTGSKGESRAVTLHVSVWVEICTFPCVKRKTLGHAPRERVSWNFN